MERLFLSLFAVFGMFGGLFVDGGGSRSVTMTSRANLESDS